MAISANRSACSRMIQRLTKSASCNGNASGADQRSKTQWRYVDSSWLPWHTRTNIQGPNHAHHNTSIIIAPTDKCGVLVLSKLSPAKCVRGTCLSTLFMREPFKLVTYRSESSPPWLFKPGTATTDRDIGGRVQVLVRAPGPSQGQSTAARRRLPARG